MSFVNKSADTRENIKRNRFRFKLKMRIIIILMVAT